MLAYTVGRDTIITRSSPPSTQVPTAMQPCPPAASTAQLGHSPPPMAALCASHALRTTMPHSQAPPHAHAAHWVSDSMCWR
jgi:hypothetical protein